jgi:hypothetical protein
MSVIWASDAARANYPMALDVDRFVLAVRATFTEPTSVWVFRPESRFSLNVHHNNQPPPESYSKFDSFSFFVTPNE